MTKGKKIRNQKQENIFISVATPSLSERGAGGIVAPHPQLFSRQNILKIFS